MKRTTSFVKEMEDSPTLKDTIKKTDAIFANGFASHLNKDELEELVRYYSEPQGEQLTKAQIELTEAMVAGQSALAMKAARGERFLQQKLPPNQKDVKEIMGLLDEFMKIQITLVDPGPNKDRSGLQAIPFMIAAVIGADSSKFLSIWGNITEQDRNAIMAWRSSPLAKKERDTIIECAKEIRKQVNPEAGLLRISEIAKQYEKKWKSLLQPTKKAE